MKPSRTFTIAILSLCLLGLELICLTLIAYFAPESLGQIAAPASTLALSIAGAGGAGAGAMGLRDYGSKGRTSSSGALVVTGRVQEAQARRGEHHTSVRPPDGSPDLHRP